MNSLPLPKPPLVKGLIFLLSLTFLSYANAQTDQLQLAQQLSHAGSFEQAKTSYEQILRSYPSHLPTRIGAAYNLSWSGDFKAGIRAFRQIIDDNPDLEDAIVGLGYSLAWDQQYKGAHQVFLSLLQKSPDSHEAKKGMAYLSLWTGKYFAARRQFTQLSQQFPNQVEYVNALGIINLRLGNHREARAAFAQALVLEPASQNARLFLSTIASEPAFIELHTWAGYSQVNTEDKLGLRALHLQWRASQKLQLWIRYDNSLTLDNFSFIRNNAVIPTWFGGGIMSWNDRWTSRLEIGQRILPNRSSSFIFQGEQVFHFGDNYAAKLGGFLAPSSNGQTEYLAFAGVQIPLSPHHQIEPLYFLSYNQNGIPTHRGVINTEYRSPSGKYRIGGGIMYGQERALQDNLPASATFGANLLCQTSLMNRHWMLLNMRYESGIQYPLFSISAGLRLRFER
ncbi:MAG: tetratricopeptide repeat protein [Bacteroidia bacterium]